MREQHRIEILKPISRWRKWLSIWRYRGNTLAEEEHSERFSIPESNPSFRFPEDDGSHPGFRIEWWYISSHILTDSGTRFGLQSTFFRLRHGEDHYFLSHMAISDPARRIFRFEERLSPESESVFARPEHLDLGNGDWRLSQSDDSGTMKLNAGVNSEIQFDLQLVPQKRHIVFGTDGVTRKSPDHTVASYYLTYPRIGVSGSLSYRGKDCDVRGEAWMDHEIASRQLADDQVGWDWIQIQFFDRWELMGYSIRGGSPVRSLVWIDPDGNQIPIRGDRFTWESCETWTSGETGASYPIHPRITVYDPRSGRETVLQFCPLMEKQELRGRLDVIYWEGSGDIRDITGEVVARAFLELTGYTGRLKEILR